MKIVLIDDSEIVLEVTAEALRAAGHEVFTYSSPIGTTAALVTHLPDVVLVDLDMPALSGERLTELMRRQRSTITTRIVLHSSRNAAELSAAAHRCGADGYICKTDRMEDLVEKVQRFAAAR